MTLYYLPQYKTTKLNVAGGIDNSQTTGIIITDVTNVDITKPGIVALTYSVPLDTDKVEFVKYTSINGSNELVGVTRGSDSFSAKTHNDQAVVAFILSSSHINEINDLLLAVESDFLVEHNADGTHKVPATFWDTMPGTPTRVSDTQFTITDTANANKYDLLFKKGAVIKWLESTTINIAMVTGSSYSSNTVTIDIVGDSLTAGFSAMKYCSEMAMVETFIIPGTLAAGTDLSKTWFTKQGIVKLSVDAYVKTAGTTNATTFDVNDDGTTIITTKPSIASGATNGLNNVCDSPTTEIAAASAVTVDIDAVSTTPPVEASVELFYIPTSWLYRS